MKTKTTKLCEEENDSEEPTISTVTVEVKNEQRELYSCGRCGQVYISRNQLENHLKTDCGKIKNFVCHCGNRYLTEANLNQHKIVHEGQKKFLCDFCGKSFLSKGQLKIHERTHTKDKPFGCGICNKRFAYRESLITHTSVHTGVKPYECQCCKKTFSCIGNLLKHRRTKPDTCGSKEFSEVVKVAPRPMTKNLTIPTIIEKKVKESKIQEIIPQKKDSEEIKIEEDFQELPTETITFMSTTLVSFVEATTTTDDDDNNKQVQITFVEEDILMTDEPEPLFTTEEDPPIEDTDDTNRELKLSEFINIEEDTFSLTCKLCPKIYKSGKVILNHLKREHDLEFDEETLKQIQSTIKELSNNIKIKTEENVLSSDYPPDDNAEASPKKSLTCSKCGKTFSSKTVLMDHERSNCGTKPVYICDICQKGYHSAGSLKTHKTMHTGELNHVCAFCGQAFRTAGQVKIHSRKHTGEKPYQCTKCDKSFGHRESLITHESVHTGLKRFMCKCGQRFSCISNLKAHRRSHKNKCGKFPLVTKPVVEMKNINTKLK